MYCQSELPLAFETHATFGFIVLLLFVWYLYLVMNDSL